MNFLSDRGTRFVRYLGYRSMPAASGRRHGASEQLNGGRQGNYASLSAAGSEGEGEDEQEGGSTLLANDGPIAVDPPLYQISPFQFWAGRLVSRIHQDGGVLEDEWLPRFSRDSSSLRRTFLPLLAAARQQHGPWSWRLLWAFVRQGEVGGMIVVGFVLEAVTAFTTLLAPWLLHKLLADPQSGSLATMLVLVTVASTLAGRARDQVTRTHAVWTETGLRAAIFGKALALSPAACAHLPAARIISLSAVDVDLVALYMQRLHDIWSAPAQILAVAGLTARVMGVWPAVAALAAMGLLFVVQGRASLLFRDGVKEYVLRNDTRLAALRLVVTRFAAVKALAVEPVFRRLIQAARAAQMGALRKYLVAGFSIFTAVSQTVPGLVACAAFAVYWAQGHELSPQVVFPALAYFGLLYQPVFSASLALSRQYSVRPSLARIGELLVADEFDTFQAGRRRQEQDDGDGHDDNDDYYYSSPRPSPSPRPGPRSRPNPNPNSNPNPDLNPNPNLDLDSDFGPEPSPHSHSYSYSYSHSPSSNHHPAASSLSDEEEKWSSSRIPAVQFDNATCAYLSLGPDLDPDHDLDHDHDYAASGSSLITSNKSKSKSRGAASYPEEQSASFLMSEVCQSRLLEIGHVRIPAQQLTLVIGPTGSGKSSLLLAILGDLPIWGGRLRRPAVRAMAYAAQEPFVLSGSLRDNVFLGSAAPFNPARYQHVLHQTGLDVDLAGCRGGVEDAVLSEAGGNLSGGQKARVGLARALYSDADLLLLDDPLAAVDARVRRRLFDCVRAEAGPGKRTVVLTTLHTQYVAHADYIVVTDETRVVWSGPKDAFMTNADLKCNYLASNDNDPEYNAGDNNNEEEEKAKDDDDDDDDDNNNDDNDKDSAKDNAEKKAAKAGKPGAGPDASLAEISASLATLATSSETPMPTPAASGPAHEESIALVTKEERAVGPVKWSVLTFYARAAGGLPQALGVLVMAALLTSVRVASQYWFVWWLDRTLPLSQAVYMVVYVLLVFLQSGLIAALGLIMVHGSMCASRQVHRQIVDNLLQAPLAYIQSHPTGRVLNRMAADVESLDTKIMNAVDGLIASATSLISSLVLVAASGPFMSIALVPFIFGTTFYIQRFRVGAREVQRSASLLASPVVSVLSESLSNPASVRAYASTAVPFLRDRHAAALDALAAARITRRSLDTWVTLRAEMAATAVLAIVAVLAWLGALDDGPASGSSAAAASAHSQSRAGLALGVASTLARNVYMLAWSATDLEIQMNSAERLMVYHDEMPREQPGGDPNAARRSLLAALGPGPGPGPGLGESGSRESGSGSEPANRRRRRHDLELQGLFLRYPSREAPALGGVSLSIPVGQRVGILGRSGSGKSTLLSALARLVTLTAGTITLGGIDIATVPPHVLRTVVHTLPQEPFIFPGTVRLNLDPEGKHSDAELLEVLEQCRLTTVLGGRFSASAAAADHDKTTTHTQQPADILDRELGHGSSELSAGQRQLLCAARVLLAKPPVLLVDEAAANIDFAGDAQLQYALRYLLPESTTLVVVAHRATSLAWMDRVVTMRAGLVVENGAPVDLLQDPQSHFASMILEDGDQALRKALQVAREPRHVEDGGEGKQESDM